jgi:hypothetical protein
MPVMARAKDCGRNNARQRRGGWGSNSIGSAAQREVKICCLARVPGLNIILIRYSSPVAQCVTS